MSVTITALEAENVKRIKAVEITPAPTGLTLVGGNNNQGKTSVLDALAWALGGDKFRPAAAARDGAITPPHLKVTLSNGIVVERRGKNSTLTVTDPTGRRAGQQLLNEFVEVLALDLPRFMDASDRDKADTLLKIIGVGEQLTAMDQRIKALYDKRTAVGQIAQQKKAYAEEMLSYPEAPAEPVSALELIQQQQEILLRNAENQRQRDRLAEVTHAKHRYADELQRLDERIEALQAQRRELKASYDAAVVAEESATKTVAQLRDESTAALEESIRNVEDTNRKVRANLDKARAEDEAAEMSAQYSRADRPDHRGPPQAHRPAGQCRPAAARPGGRGRLPDLPRQALAGHERQRPAARGHRHCAPPEPQLRLCAAGQAGADGPCHTGRVRPLAGDRGLAGHRHAGLDRQRVPDHHRGWAGQRGYRSL